MGACADGNCGCPACAAERQGSPVLQALEFGLRMASAKCGDSRFWQMAAASDMALSVARPASTDAAAVLVRRTMEAVSAFPSEFGVEDLFAGPPAVTPERAFPLGKVSTGDSAAPALEGGWLLASTSLGGSGPWKVSQAAQELESLRGSASYEKVPAYARSAAEHLGTAIGVSQGSMAISARSVPPIFPLHGGADPAQPGPAASELEAVWLRDAASSGLFSPPFNPSAPLFPQYADFGQCCVKEFQYPVPQEGDRGSIGDKILMDLPGRPGDPRQGEFGRPVDVSFRVAAVFDDELSCYCACCEFRQWILRDSLTVTPILNLVEASYGEEPMGGASLPLFDEPLRQDCLWLVWDPALGRYRSHAGSPEKKPQPREGTPPNNPILGPLCVGDPDAQRAAEERGVLAGGPGFYTACRYDLLDRARELVPLENKFKWDLVFAGVIMIAATSTSSGGSWYSTRRWRASY